MKRVAHILIVDDDVRNCKLLQVLLEPEGYDTICVHSGDAALAAIALRVPDLILLDIVMSGMTGLELASALKANPATATIPIIMITGRIGRDMRLAGLDAGAEDFLTKPVDRAELWLRVRNLLRLKTLRDRLLDHSVNLEREVQLRTIGLQGFRSAMDATADAIFLIDHATMRFVEVNATACGMFGYSRDELLQLGPVDLDGARWDEYSRIYDDIIQSGNASDLDEVDIRRKDGSIMPVEVRRHALQTNGEWIIVAVLRDITARKEAEQHLHYLAHYDTLTGLPNRTLFHETLTRALARAAERNWRVAVLFIDLDRFKDVNDTLGHAAGDRLLREFADRLIECVRVRDTIGRLGGDEFALILTMHDAQHSAAQAVGQIRDAMRAPFDIAGHSLSIGASIGIALYPGDAQDADALIRYSDTAMYRAKQAGRDTFRFFTSKMNHDVLAKLDLEVALRRAIDEDEFCLHYQPKVDVVTGDVVGFEALLRWERPGMGLLTPEKFVPLLEETGMIQPVGRWVIATACAQIAAWQRSGLGAIPISVNVSARQFAGDELEKDIMQSLGDNATLPAMLELELTESTLMENSDRTIATLQSLKQRGVQISIDDFGTGYSSLAYLRHFKIDKLKIDMAFIRDVTTNADDAAIVRTIIDLAHRLRLQVVAEGVETGEQLAFLREYDCDQVQGWLFGKPVPPYDAGELLKIGRRTIIEPHFSVSLSPPS